MTRNNFLLILVFMLSWLTVQAEDGVADTLESDLAALRAYDFGDDRAPLVRVQASVRASITQPDLRRLLEQACVSIIDADCPAGATDFAFRQLRIVGSQGSSAKLARWLTDADHHDAALGVVERISDAWAGDLIANALRQSTDPHRTVGFLNSLATREDRQHLTIVLDRIHDENREVSAAAIDALGALARPSEFPAAVDAREDEFTRELLEAAARDLSDPDRGIVVLALSKMLERSDGRDPNAVAALTTWFAISPETALDTVIRWLDAPHRLGQQTATGLLQQLANGDPILDRVIDQLEPIEAEHTELYLDMAAKHGGATVRRIVERAVDESRDLANRLLAIRALGRTSLPPEAVDTLLELAALERDARRTAAREALKTARGPVTDRVCQRLTDPEWEIRAEAARTLGVRGATDRIGQLLAALEDENGRVRTSTWAAIGEIATGADYGELCTRLFKTRTSREREHASRAIALVARRYPVDPAGDIDRSITLNGPGGHRFRAPLGDWQTVGSVSLQSQSPRRLNAEAGSGVLTNGETGRTRHLVSDVEHGSISAHVEFLVPKGSNSGVYFMGRYEIQILDSHGKSKVSFSDCGGIYQRWTDGKGYEGHSPRVNASKPAGEWQSFDIEFRAPEFDSRGSKISNASFAKVVHNGVTVHENIELTGPTRAAMFADEKRTGPLMLQGDHGPIAYRNVTITPLSSKEDQRSLPLLDPFRECDSDTRDALRPTVFSILTTIGGEKAFSVLAGIVNNDPATTQQYGGGIAAQRAAIRALAEWPEDRAIDTLIDAVRSPTDAKSSTVAMRGALRQLRNSKRESEEKLQRYRDLVPLAQNTDTKRALLSGLGELDRAEALALIEPYLNDPDVRSEAALASFEVCEEIITTHPDLVSERIPHLEPLLGDTVQERVAVVKAGLELLATIIPRWRVSGPYQRANTGGGELLRVPFPPESADEPASWRPVRANRGEVDLSALLGGSDRCAYLEALIHSERRVQVRLDIGSDDGVIAWLNDQEVHRNAAARPYQLGQDRVRVALEKGPNRLLLKVTQIGGGWAAGVRVLSSDGKPVDGVTFDLRAP